LAYQQHDATASTSVQEPTGSEAATPDVATRRRTSRRRIVLALSLGALVALAAAIPAGAAWPVATKSSYVSQWSSTKHRALDIAAAGGTRIVPIRSGKVIFAGWKSNCGGYQVWLSHGNGLYSAYYHMSRTATAKGRAVTNQTTTLGYVGKTGCATGNHLHLEVWKGWPWRSGSYRVNPWNYVNSGTYLPTRYR
jgi:murein DD-endopeptidase MepM/ murein hydrolase activator NlpD